MLHGRETEKATIANLVASARLGVGASLAVLGEAGAGKSSLLTDTARQAALGMTVVTTSDSIPEVVTTVIPSAA